MRLHLLSYEPIAKLPITRIIQSFVEGLLTDDVVRRHLALNSLES